MSVQECLFEMPVNHCQGLTAQKNKLKSGLYLGGIIGFVN